VLIEIKEELERKQEDREQHSAQPARKFRKLLRGMRKADEDEDSLKDLKNKLKNAVDQFQV
jgi:hypothetical protein